MPVVSPGRTCSFAARSAICSRVQGTVEHVRSRLPAGIATVEEEEIEDQKQDGWVRVRLRAERLEWIPSVLASLDRPASQLRIKALMERGFHRPGDVEDRLGYHVGQLGG